MGTPDSPPPLPGPLLPSEGAGVCRETKGAGAPEHQQEAPTRHSAPLSCAAPGFPALSGTR